MTKNDGLLWPAEPHTLAKIAILKAYLEAWFPILCTRPWVRELVYIDSCCGPGEYKGGELGSPITALEVARKCKSCSQRRLSFHFIDNDERYIEHLTGMLIERSLDNNTKFPSTFNIVSPIHGDAVDQTSRILAKMQNNAFSTTPVFVFFDGFSNIAPMSLFDMILNRRSSEVLLFFNNIDALRNSSSERILKCLGAPDPSSKSPFITFEEQMKNRATYICRFEIRDSYDNPKYYLIFASNNETGFLKMKEAMWKISYTRAFTFSDYDDPNHQLLFNSDDVAYTELKHLLCSKYGNCSNVAISDIETFVKRNTGYLPKHMREVFRNLEREKLINRPRRLNGEPVKREFPEGSIIDLPKHFCGCEKCRIQA